MGGAVLASAGDALAAAAVAAIASTAARSRSPWASTSSNARASSRWSNQSAMLSSSVEASSSSRVSLSQSTATLACAVPPPSPASTRSRSRSKVAGNSPRAAVSANSARGTTVPIAACAGSYPTSWARVSSSSMLLLPVPLPLPNLTRAAVGIFRLFLDPDRDDVVVADVFAGGQADPDLGVRPVAVEESRQLLLGRLLGRHEQLVLTIALADAYEQGHDRILHHPPSRLQPEGTARGWPSCEHGRNLVVRGRRGEGAARAGPRARRARRGARERRHRFGRGTRARARGGRRRQDRARPALLPGACRDDADSPRRVRVALHAPSPWPVPRHRRCHGRPAGHARRRRRAAVRGRVGARPRARRRPCRDPRRGGRALGRRSHAGRAATTLTPPER